MESSNQEPERCFNLSICNQKGGVGKSTFTVLLASCLHYSMGHDVLVVDCDYPQWSIHAQRERELEAIGHSDYYKLMMVRQFKATGRKLWPVIRCMPSEATAEVACILQSGYRPRIIFYDLPVRSTPKVSSTSSRRWMKCLSRSKPIRSSWRVRSLSPEP